MNVEGNAGSAGVESGARHALLAGVSRVALALALTPASLLAGVAPADAASIAANTLPSGGSFVAGSGSFARAGTQLTVSQSTQRAVVDWQSFSIGPAAKVAINNGAQGATLNRVTGGDPSRLFGQLTSQGTVYLLNPQGIVIGRGGSIVAGGTVVLSTLDLANNAFMAGGSLDFAGAVTAGVENRGTISSSGGNVVLIAHSVSNSGTISAANGTAALAAGQEVLLQEAAGSEHVFVEAPGGSVTNSGSIAAAEAELKAAGGNIYALAGNNGGAIRATGTATIDGHVWLTAEGGSVEMQGGSIAAQNANGTGGTIEVIGKSVALTAGTIDASGENGGGTVHTGGDFHGAGGHNATTVTVDAGVTIDASARGRGNGGRVAVWSDDTTTFGGTILARGGAQGGDGGQVETSGRGTLALKPGARVDTGATNGRGGNWLLDPTDFTVDATAATAIVGDVAGSDVTVTASGNIFINAAVRYSSSHELSFLAQQSIHANAPVQNSGSGAVNLVAGWDGITQAPAGAGINLASVNIATLIAAPGAFGIGGGSVFIGDGTQSSFDVAIGGANGTTTVATSDLTVQANNNGGPAFGGAQLGFSTSATLAGPGPVVSTTGGIMVQAKGAVTLNAGPNATGGQNIFAQIGHGGLASDSNATVAGPVTNSGAITINAASVTLTAGAAPRAYAQIGHGGELSFSALTTTNGGIGDSGTITLNVSGAVRLTGAPAAGLAGTDTYAQIGHGGFNQGFGAHISGGDASNSGDISIAAGSLSLQGNHRNNGYAQIGHGGSGAFNSATLASPGSIKAIGNIAIALGSGNLGLAGGSNPGTYAMIGHGGNSFGTGAIIAGGDLLLSGAIGIVAGSASLTGGSNGGTFAQIGHGGGAFSAAHVTGLGDSPAVGAGGDINLTLGGALTLSAGSSGSEDYAQIGHGGAFSGANLILANGSYANSGSITVTATSATLTGNGNAGGLVAGSDALIGHGGQEALVNANISGGALNSGDISVTTTVGALQLIAGANQFGEAQIGHGGAATFIGATLGASSGQSGNISVAARGPLTLSGNGANSYAQIGHGGRAAEQSAHVTGNFANTGNITVSAPSATLTAGGNNGAFVQIGHGGRAVFTNSTATGRFSNSGNIAVNIAGTLAMLGGTNPSSTAYAQIGMGDGSHTPNGIGTASGIVDVRAGGTLTLRSNIGGTDIGDGTSTPGGISGANVLIVANGINDNATAGMGTTLAGNIARDLAGGSVTVATASDLTVAGAISSAAGNELDLLSRGNFSVNAPIQSGGTVNVMAGWDGASGLPMLGSGGAFSFAAAKATNFANLNLNSTIAATGAGDALQLVTGGRFNNNTGTPAPLAVSGGGRWLVWSQDPGQDSRFGLVYDFKQYNATFGTSAPAQATGNGVLYTLAPVVTAGLTGTVAKVYDGTTTATLTPPNYTLTGAVDGDTVIITNPPLGSYPDRNVGMGKLVTVNGIAIVNSFNGAATVYGSARPRPRPRSARSRRQR